MALQAPVISDQTTGPLHRTANSELVLFVGAGGDLEPTFQWHLNGQPIPGAVSFEYRQPAVQIEHAGAYTCVVKNSRGKKTTLPVQVTVVDPAASEQPLYLGKDSSLAARVANASGTVVWRKDGIILQEGGRYKDTAKTVLRILATTEEDLGIYTCELTTAQGVFLPGPMHAVPVSEVPVVV
ncbi:MAG TPA: immunoglobulin domain-containing protein, partial [Prosthecobacter sp.]